MNLTSRIWTKYKSVEGFLLRFQLDRVPDVLHHPSPGLHVPLRQDCRKIAEAKITDSDGNSQQNHRCCHNTAD